MNTSKTNEATQVVTAVAAPPAHLKYFGYFSNESGTPPNVTYQLETNPHTTMMHLASLWWDTARLRSELAMAKENGIKVILSVDGFVFNENSFVISPSAQENWNTLAQELYVNGFIDIEFPENGTVVSFYLVDEPNLHGFTDYGTQPNQNLQRLVNMMRGNPLTQNIPISTIVAYHASMMSFKATAQLYDWVGYDHYGPTTAQYLSEFDQTFKQGLGIGSHQRTMLVPLCAQLTWKGFNQSWYSDPYSILEKAASDPSVIAIVPFIWRTPGGDTIAGLREPAMSNLRVGYENVGRSIKAGPAGYNSEFLSQSIPQTMQRGGNYQVTVQYKNKGNTWQPGAVRLGTQNPHDNMTWGTSRAELSGSVGFNGIATLTFFVRAPSAPGVYDMRFQLLLEGQTWFGPMTPNMKVTVV